jgi:hypothetical protein
MIDYNLLNNISLAENHIGVSLKYYKVGAEDAFTGIISSVIIGAFGNNGFSDLDDSLLRKQPCQAFTFSDPWGLSTSSCDSVVGPYYRRVGILLPQFTNGPKTCATAGRFRCDPPNVPDRMCGMPWELRFGLPVSMLYAETHLHNVTFLGFHANASVSDSYRSAAIALNPSQVDQQSTVVSSGLKWTDNKNSLIPSSRMDNFARIGIVNSGNSLECDGHWCMGLEMLIFHDIDGTLGRSIEIPTYKGGQIVLGNGVFNAPSPRCFSASELGLNLMICPKHVAAADNFRQYSALWRDPGQLIIGPLLVTRSFGIDDNRTYPSYEPKSDMCVIETTGTVPPMWTLRWDAPSSDDVAVLEMFISEGGAGGSSVINVFVGDSENGDFTFIPRFTDRFPNKTDAAGSNTRDPQRRILMTTIRGGAKNFYRFVVTPVVAVTIRMEMTLDQFFSDKFIVNIATLLGIPYERIAIANVRQGSVIVDFSILPTGVVNDLTQYTQQVNDLRTLSDLFLTAASAGNLSRQLNVTVLNLAVEPPVVPVVIDENVSPVNITVRPTATPSKPPSKRPSHSPTLSPTTAPTLDGVTSDATQKSVTEETYFIPLVIAVGVFSLIGLLTLLTYCLGCCCFAVKTKNKLVRHGPHTEDKVVVPTVPKRVVPTTNSNRIPAHMLRNFQGDPAGGASSGESLFVKALDHSDSNQHIDDTSRKKPGPIVTKHSETQSFEELGLVNIIKNGETYRLGDRDGEEAVEVYFDGATPRWEVQHV